MPRIHPVAPESANADQTEVLNAVKEKMGKVPNIVGTMAQSPAVANAYLAFSQALGNGTLPASLREQLALVVGEENKCGYCTAAHTALGKSVGLSEDEINAARRGTSVDEKTSAALSFAKQLVQKRGEIEDEEVEELRQAGYSDGEIAEIVANVALSIFTNYFNHVAETQVDFPEVPALV